MYFATSPCDVVRLHARKLCNHFANQSCKNTTNKLEVNSHTWNGINIKNGSTRKSVTGTNDLLWYSEGIKNGGKFFRGTYNIGCNLPIIRPYMQSEQQYVQPAIKYCCELSFYCWHGSLKISSHYLYARYKKLWIEVYVIFWHL